MVGVTKRHVCSVKHCGSRTRSLDPADHTRPLCKEHGGEDADASARLVGLRQGARNVHEEQLHQVAVLAAFVNASAVSTVEKVHGQQTANALFQKVASDPQVLKFLQHDEWTEHARGEANFALNATDLYLRDFLHHTQFSEQLLHLFVTRLHFNADGASKTLFSDYERMFGQPLAEGKTFSRATFLEAALSHNIPSHYPHYKLQLYNNERNRQLSNGTVADTHDTKKYGFQLRETHAGAGPSVSEIRDTLQNLLRSVTQEGDKVEAFFKSRRDWCDGVLEKFEAADNSSKQGLTFLNTDLKEHVASVEEAQGTIQQVQADIVLVQHTLNQTQEMHRVLRQDEAFAQSSDALLQEHDQLLLELVDNKRRRRRPEADAAVAAGRARRDRARPVAAGGPRGGDQAPDRRQDGQHQQPAGLRRGAQGQL
ncbi:unnamed protein product [Prorocentrum cordatum]|uniref:Uncharacterized protein n=1 Tax=Prorocentrum cordatum TaxID=2364126 RepID=A0ABN9YCE0_9DINO|nr:unnamed protein product [Polarella glacialis]